MNPELKTERLILTPLQACDVDIAIAIWCDPVVVKHICEPASEAEIRTEMRLATRRGGNGAIGVWCISDPVTLEKVGSCYLLPLPINEDDTNWDLLVPGSIPAGDIEVGYMLKPSAWGKGFASEVCRRLIRLAFEETPLQEVVAIVDVNNHASRSILENTGFSPDGKVRAYGKEEPIFRITRKHWELLNSS